jgi:hypothetical protein
MESDQLKRDLARYLELRERPLSAAQTLAVVVVAALVITGLAFIGISLA